LKEPSDGEQDPLAALRAGHPGPFEAFVVSETPRLMAFFARLGASQVEAEDLVQELFLKLFQQAQHYEHQGRFVPYVLRVARNAWIDRVRRRAVRVDEARPSGSAPAREDADTELAESDVAWAASREADPSASAAQREQVAALRRAWCALPEHHRLVFELGVLQERSYQEIGELLDVPVGTVKSRMFYALRKLRELSSQADSELPLRGSEGRA
jgi:RNA polymerase sigma-70 factor (ECF subfamily)